jgi:YD repeat-containing protein
MERIKRHASRYTTQHLIPQQLLGDWNSDGWRWRFNYDGSYSLVIEEHYSIENDQILHLTHESYRRLTGTTGVVGTWRTSFDGGDWLDLTFGPYGFYAYEWNDGFVGGGYYSATDSEIIIVEHRARVSCSGNTIAFTFDGQTESGTFTVEDNILTIQFSDQRIVEYTKLPF